MSGQALPLRIFLLGPPEVRLGAQALTFPTRKALALLIYLALEAGEQPRERLAALLWPEASPARSYASLRNTLGRLLAALRRPGGRGQTDFISVTRQALALNPEADIQVDLHLLEGAYAQARADRSNRMPPAGSDSLALLQSAAACHRGEFLAGFSPGAAPGFDDWAGVQREAWRRRLGLVLDRLSEIQFAGGEFAAAAETAATWSAVDPLNEAAYRRKMRAHFAAGERGQALETYHTCRALLATELQAEPEPETEALAARLRVERPPDHSQPAPGRPDTPVAFLESLFVGRAAEQRQLAEQFAQAAAGQPQVALLRGEAGIGKTRLARHFLELATAQGAETLSGGAYESGSHLPFQPLAEALRAWFKREPASDELAGEAGLALLGEFLPELRDRYPEPPPMPGAPEERVRLFETFVRLTFTLAQRAPLVVFVDDLHWADSATLDLLQYALRRWREAGARVMLLAGLRSEGVRGVSQPGAGDIPRWLAQLEREVKPVHLLLELLGEPETVQMLLDCLAPPAPDFAQWLFSETHGQPFYLMETLKDLLERGVLRPKRRTAGHWRFAVDVEHNLGQAVRIPSTVRAVILSRLQRLSPPAFALLAAGAVLEHRLTFERLCATANIPLDAALPAIDELISSRLLLELAPPMAASAYAFPNDMLRDVVYTQAGDARRRLFHRRALAILTAAKDPAAVLAHHALVAGEVKPAFQYSLAAGKEALRLSAVGEAIVHFETAHQLAREASRAGAAFETRLRDLYRQLSLAYTLGGQPAQAEAVQMELERLKAEPR